MDSLDALAAVNRLMATIVRLTQALAAPPAALAGGLAGQLHHQLGRIGAQLTHMVVRMLGAPTPPRQPSQRKTKPPQPDRRSPPRPTAAIRLPRRLGWLLDALPETAPAIASEIRDALQDPAAAALLAENPAIRRLLQPLCRMLGLDLASFLPIASPPPARPLIPSQPPAEARTRPGAALLHPPPAIHSPPPHAIACR